MDTITVPLSPEQKSFVEHQVQAGGYASVSEYVHRLIDEDQQRKSHHHIDRKLLEALDSGPSTPWTAEGLESIRRRLIERHPELADERYINDRPHNSSAP